MRLSRVIVGLAAAVLAATTLTSCSPTVSVPPGPNSNDPQCAKMMTGIRNVQVLGGFDRVWTDSQGTVAWGTSPTAIILSCGVEELGASTFPCETIGGVDWIIDNSDPKFYRMTTFGRTPAAQVFINLDALREQQLGGVATTDSDAGAVVTRIAKYLSDFESNGKRCTDRPNP